jgi:hypothetical protein
MQFFKDLVAHVTGIEVEGSYKTSVPSNQSEGSRPKVYKVDPLFLDGVPRHADGTPDTRRMSIPGEEVYVPSPKNRY